MSFRKKLWDLLPKTRVITDDDGEIINEISPDGLESPDPTPLDPPLGYNRTPSLADQIREMIRSEKLAMEAHEAGFDSFEEDDDFDIADGDFDPRTPYENNFDPSIKDIHEAVAEHASQEQSKEKSKPAKPAPVTEPAQPAPSAEPLPEA